MKAPKYRAILYPAKNDDWDTGARAVLVDDRNGDLVQFDSLSVILFAKRRSTEYWANLTIKGARFRVPLTITNKSRKGDSCPKARKLALVG